MVTDSTSIRRRYKYGICHHIMLCLAAGCAQPLLVVETSEALRYGENTSRTCIVDSAGVATVFLTSDKPALAVAWDPYNQGFARAVRVDDSIWVHVYSKHTGKAASIYRLPAAGGYVELSWPYPGRLVVLADDKLHVIAGGGKPEPAASLKGFVYDRTGLRFASFGDIDVPARSLAGVQVAVPEGLRPLCFSPAGDVLLAVDAEGALHLHKTRTGLTQRLSLFAASPSIPKITDACYSSDGAYFFVTAAADKRISLYYGTAAGQKSYSTLASISTVSGHASLEILGAGRACVYLLADGDKVLRYRLSDKNLSTLFSTTGRITACCMISGR